MYNVRMFCRDTLLNIASCRNLKFSANFLFHTANILL